MKNLNPDYWGKLLQEDCVTLVEKNLGIKIKEEDVDISSPNFAQTLNLIVNAMK